MSASHTPGPWRKAHSDTSLVYVVACDESGDVASITSKLDGKNNGVRVLEQHANAAVIAAAPELLSAARHALNSLHAVLAGCDDASGACAEIRAAIAKATGRSAV